MQQPALIRAPEARLRLADLGSPRLALWLIGALALAVVAGYAGLSDMSWSLAVPLTLLAANLAAAIATHPAFRAQGGLLVFHLALVAVILFAAAGRLTYLKGAVELSDGQPFDGALMQRESGPLHGGGLARVRFTSLGFEVHYGPGMKRAQTFNRVAYSPAGVGERTAVIGDTTPLRLEGYRFYTTPNKGFAPELIWTPHGGAPLRGTLHMPSFPAQLTRQKLEWTPPGAARALQTRLDLDAYRIDLASDWVLGVPPEHAFEVSEGGATMMLRPGESRRLAEGTLTYVGLRMWMGYSVFYDWTLPWLLAAGAICVAALSWHLAARFRARPWQAGSQGERR